ncbi:MAG: hypothetical protein K8T91_08280 [Planctomycetes bacterium]|nr:hypothetical protein [Planctomycetota bacterium]
MWKKWMVALRMLLALACLFAAAPTLLAATVGYTGGSFGASQGDRFGPQGELYVHIYPMPANGQVTQVWTVDDTDPNIEQAGLLFMRSIESDYLAVHRAAP